MLCIEPGSRKPGRTRHRLSSDRLFVTPSDLDQVDAAADERFLIVRCSTSHAARIEMSTARIMRCAQTSGRSGTDPRRAPIGFPGSALVSSAGCGVSPQRTLNPPGENPAERLLYPGSADCQPAVVGSLPTTFLHTFILGITVARWLASCCRNAGKGAAGLSNLPAGSLRSRIRWDAETKFVVTRRDDQHSRRVRYPEGSPRVIAPQGFNPPGMVADDEMIEALIASLVRAAPNRSSNLPSVGRSAVSKSDLEESLAISPT